MTTRVSGSAVSDLQSIPLLESGFLPSAEDWALLESMQTDVRRIDWFDPDSDRDGGFRLAAAFDD